MSKLTSKLYNPALDQQGKEIKFDIREDEEQDVKLQETIDLLVAAGYFRARIKGLSAFDKIVGGMTWCIDTCNFDVDVDLLFNESSTIGQKISLTERIVRCLPKMKCPHPIEPHQIQGLDFIHIYPVVQWLVKRAVETRSEMGDLNRNFALLQFDKVVPNCVVSDIDEKKKAEHAIKTLDYLKTKNQPQRKYLRKDLPTDLERHVRVQSTLLEYGQQNIILLNNKQQGTKQSNKLESSKPANTDEENDLKRLMNEMSETDSKKQSKVSASTVGQILGIQQDAIQQIVDEFSTKESQLQQEIDSLDETTGGLQHKIRLLNMLKKQLEHRQIIIDEKKADIEKLEQTRKEAEQKLQDVKTDEGSLKETLSKLTDYETNIDKKSIEKLQKLVTVNDELKSKEQEFKKSCKKELAEIEAELDALKLSLSMNENGRNQENERISKINEQYEAANAKLKTLRLKVAKKNREISTLKRRLDEIPSRIELSQYQKRFVELYNQISAVHTQTKQFFIFYNMLEEKKFFMSKEISLLNSINEQFGAAMSSSANKEQFVKQLEVIVEGIKTSLVKVSNKKLELKSMCDEKNDQLNELFEKKRLYYKTLKDFQEECKKNEFLLAKN